MFPKTVCKPLTFFSKSSSDNGFVESAKKLLFLVDYSQFQESTLALIKQLHSDEATLQWQLFCTHLKSSSDNKAEKLLIMRTAFSCLINPIEQGQLAQLITLMRHLKSVYGVEIFHILLKAEIANDDEKTLSNYLQISALLIDLHEDKGIVSLVKKSLPKLSVVLESLRKRQSEVFAAKYPARNLDAVIKSFGEKDSLIQFPIEQEELAQLKTDYAALINYLPSLSGVPQSSLELQLKQQASLWREQKNPIAKQQMLAILAETIRRQYGILPYDTQLIAILALINTPEKLKGRIAQIKTGEGKSTIIAMLASFMAAQGNFVDMVTSSGYLAIRDCRKYQPYFKALGLTASHISHRHPQKSHFEAQILYGTNTDFEFALLRDGLYGTNLRWSRGLDGLLIPRPFDVAIIDENDNLFLDTALNSAQLGITDYGNISWIYSPIFEFVRTKPEDLPINGVLIAELRDSIEAKVNASHRNKLKELSDRHLHRWYQSAHTALHKKKENRDYLLKASDDKSSEEKTDKLEITIVDYAFTGRANQGSQWQHGVHQFLQLKHQLPLTPASKTGASISHPAYFNLYRHILGLTGTLGEATEREEIQKIYQVGSFDTPPTFPSIRKRHTDYLFADKKAKWAALLLEANSLSQRGSPVLILFKTIEESNAFSAYLLQNNTKHQVLNETQKEAEDYVVAQAGESGVITIATNTAGRGTDIIPSPESKAAGGLEVLFSFYPDSLRVEEQGFGRTGRQGQPGGARMMLSMEDETIKELLKMEHSQTIPLKMAILAHLTNQASSSTPLSADNIVAMLKTLRTSRIQTESARRYACSQEEINYFTKLKHFFENMSRLNSVVDSAVFSKSIQDLCASNLYQEQETPLFDPKNPYWTGLQDMATSLLEKQVEGISVDWAAFTGRFKKAFCMHVRDLWASYYSKLRDEIEAPNREAAYSQIEDYLKNPETKAMAIVHSLMASGIHTISAQRTAFGLN